MKCLESLHSKCTRCEIFVFSIGLVAKAKKLGFIALCTPNAVRVCSKNSLATKLLLFIYDIMRSDLSCRIDVSVGTKIAKTSTNIDVSMSRRALVV